MARATTDRRRGSIQHEQPIYPVFQQFKGVRGCFTGKGTDSKNDHFLFARPTAHQDPVLNPNHFRMNLQRLACTVGFEPGALVLPNGAWPHSGEAIKDEDYAWVANQASGTLMPVTGMNQPVTYDAVASRSPTHVLGVQGADCPAIFLYDPCSRVLGLAHAGWKPLVRNHGIIAYCQNGESHDAKVSTIGAMMPNPEVSPAHFFPHHVIPFHPVLKMSNIGHISVPVLVEEIRPLGTLLLLIWPDLTCAAPEKGRRCCTRRQRRGSAPSTDLTETGYLCQYGDG
jgi:hypothetical protein